MSGPSQVIDLCGYVQPAAELLYERALGPLRGHWPQLEARLALTAPTAGIGDWNSSYTRFVTRGDIAKATPRSHPTPATLPRASHVRDDLEHRVLHDNRAGRLRALDRMGIDIQFLHPGPDIDAIMELDRAEATLLFNAYNSYITTYCEIAPQRLKSVLQFNAADPEWLTQELQTFANHPSVGGITLHFPIDADLNGVNVAKILCALAKSGLPLFCRPMPVGSELPQLLAQLFDSSVFECWPALRLVLVGWQRSALVEWTSKLWPRDDQDERAPRRAARIFFADERLGARTDGNGSGDDIPIDATLWASHFPFDDPALSEKIRPPRHDDTAARAMLSDNPRSLLDYRGLTIAAE